MKFRSLTAFLLAVLMLLGACSNGDVKDKKDTAGAVTTVAEQTTEPEVAEPSTIISKNGYVYESDSCKITSEMLQFMFYYDFYNTYGETSEQYNLNTDLTFTEQLCYAAEKDGITWQEQLTDNITEDIEDAVVYIEHAAKNGYSYTTVDESIETTLDQWESTGNALGLPLDGYIKAYYGTNITEDIARWALQVIFSATEYRDYLNKDFEDSLDDEDYDNYYSENRLKFDIVDIIEYDMYINFNGVINEDRVEDIIACHTEEEFKAKVEENIRYFNSQLNNPKTEEALALTIENSTKTIQSYYTEGGEFSEWAFAEERQVGDTFYLEKNDGMYHIYFLQKTAYPFVKETADFMHMYCSVEANGSAEAAKAKADELYAEWKAGEATKESFEKMAKENNDDPEYLYINALKSYISGEFNTWLFTEDREVGDTAVVTTDYGGYHVVYYLGEGMPEWKITAKENMLNECTENTMNELLEEGDVLSEIDYDFFDKLPNILPEGARDYKSSDYNTVY